MPDSRVPEELLQLEDRELTDLLRRDDNFAHLRSSNGVILTPRKECVLFETAPDESLIRWEVIDDPETLTNAFQAVLVGVAMVRAGQIS